MAETRFIVAGGLIDGSGGDVRRQVFLAVQDGTITAIGAASDMPRHAGLAIDDLSHCILLPALVDCSVRLSRSPALDPSPRLAADGSDPARQEAALVERHIRYCHSHGVLGVAASDDPSDLLTPYCQGLPPGDLIVIRRSGHPVRRRQDEAPDGDFLRIAYSRDIEDQEGPAGPGPRHADLRQLPRLRDGRKLVGVANGRQQVAAALAAGCDAIEQGYGLGEDNLRQMARQGVLWLPSLVRAKNALDGTAGGGEVACRFSQRYVAPGPARPGAEAFWQRTLAEHLAHMRRARDLGVKTAVGTGSGSVGLLHGESVVEEMKLFIKAGYSLTETIRCASENGAAFFGMPGLGRLEIGRPATFLLTRGTVQQLPRKLAYLEGIYLNGVKSPLYRKHPLQAAR